MQGTYTDKVHEIHRMRERVRLFGTRTEAGAVLASMMEAFRGTEAIVMGIPAGGVPVAAALAGELGLELDVAVVSKITPPWNSEVGYGAVAYDGTVQLNEEFLHGLALDREEIRQGIDRTTDKVRRRYSVLRAGLPAPELHGRTVILVDDGLATGWTMRVAAAAAGKAGAQAVLVAVPTAHEASIHALLDHVDAVYCANVRSGLQFAVADAYRNWRDLDEQEVLKVLRAALARQETAREEKGTCRQAGSGIQGIEGLRGR